MIILLRDWIWERIVWAQALNSPRLSPLGEEILGHPGGRLWGRIVRSGFVLGHGSYIVMMPDKERLRQLQCGDVEVCQRDG